MLLAYQRLEVVSCSEALLIDPSKLPDKLLGPPGGESDHTIFEPDNNFDQALEADNYNFKLKPQSKWQNEIGEQIVKTCQQKTRLSYEVHCKMQDAPASRHLWLSYANPVSFMRDVNEEDGLVFSVGEGKISHPESCSLQYSTQWRMG